MVRLRFCVGATAQWDELGMLPFRLSGRNRRYVSTRVLQNARISDFPVKVTMESKLQEESTVSQTGFMIFGLFYNLS